MLRLDDTDTSRGTQEYEDAIYEDMKWLGLEWDKFDRQTARYDRYAEAFEVLKQAGRLYPCYETPEELDIKRKVQLSRGKPPIYDRSALDLTEADIKKFEEEGRVPHWRFKLAAGKIEWQDEGRGGLVSFDAAHIGDPVLYRADMKPIYMLASTMDDIDHGVTHVIRGEDHITNTAIMIQICEALGGTPPTFAHLSMITMTDGEKMSKRKGSTGIRDLREQGIEPLAIVSHLSKLGSSDAIEVRTSMQALCDEFDISKYSRATPKFDSKELLALNAKLLHQMPFDQVKPKLDAMGVEISESFWNTVRGNLSSLSELQEWMHVINGPVSPVIQDSGFAETAAGLLPAEPWDRETFKAWTGELKEKSGRKGKELFMPIRLALTGMEHGPELPDLLPLLGYDKTLKRLQGEAV